MVVFTFWRYSLTVIMDCESGSLKRIPNFTPAEKDFLINLIAEKYAPIIEDKKTNRTNMNDKSRAWENIAVEFNNSAQSACYRNADQLKRLYENKKKELRRKLAHNKKEVFKTGGGSPHEQKLDPVDDRLIQIVNEKTVRGLDVQFDSDSMYEETCEKKRKLECDLLTTNKPSTSYADNNIDSNIEIHFEENIRRCPPKELQSTPSYELRTPNATFNVSRRRPTQGITTLTSSHISEKYNKLLDRRLVLVEKQIEELTEHKQQQQREEQKQKLLMLKLQQDVFELDKEERKLKIEALTLDISSKRALFQV